jgi:hypothetical protein
MRIGRVGETVPLRSRTYLRLRHKCQRGQRTESELFVAFILRACHKQYYTAGKCPRLTANLAVHFLFVTRDRSDASDL